MNKVKRMIHGFVKYRYLLSELVKKGIILKYRRSYCNLRRTAATGAFASGHPAEPNGHLH